MPEAEVIAETQPIVASTGKPMLARQDQPVVNKPVEVEINDVEKDTDLGNKPPAPKEFTEEDRKAFFKTLGVEYGGEADLEAIKERLNPKPVNAEPTEEEKKAAALAEEKEILDLFIANGGTPENFVGIKNIMNADVKELSRSEKLRELTEAGFDKAEAEVILKERYYQDKLDNLEINDDETDEEFTARKAKLEKRAAFFSTKLDNSASYAKTQAEQLYNNFKTLISEKKLEAKREIEHAANAEAFLKTLPREQTFELGKLNGQDLAPVLQKVEENDISVVAEILGSTANIKQFLYNEDGSFNLPNLTEALLARQTKNAIARNSLLEGQTRMTKVFRTQFPASTPYELGVGGAPQHGSQKGKVASFGKPQKA